MKLLNIIDLTGQTLLLGGTLLVAIGMIVIGDGDAALTIMFFGALWLGPWQLISSFITTVSRGLYFRWRVTHLVLSFGYFVMLAGSWAVATNVELNEGVKYAFATIGVLIPLGLAVFYYYITYMTFKSAHERPRAMI